MTNQKIYRKIIKGEIERKKSNIAWEFSLFPITDEDINFDPFNNFH
jgi:hypothetical protein